MILSRLYSSFFLLTLLFFLLLPHSAYAETPASAQDRVKTLKITRVTPSGENVPSGRQIVFQFNRPVVPIGRMEREQSEIPVTITPPLACQWRWLNTSSLACQLDDANALRKATAYHIAMQPGIQAEDGATINEVYTHHFMTRRPEIYYTAFHNWKGPGTPVLRLTFNQPVSKASVEKSLVFAYRKDGKGSPYITQKIHAEKDPSDYENPYYITAPGEGYQLDLASTEAAPDTHATLEAVISKKTETDMARKVWLISPKQPLPLDSKVHLNAAPGIMSALGAELGTEERTVKRFHTFPAFTFLGVNCTRNDGKRIYITAENADNSGTCNPLKNVTLAFSSPVVVSQIKNNIIFTPDLAGGRKDYDPWANRRDYVYLNRAHSKGRSYTIHVPESLKAAHSYNVHSKPADKSSMSMLQSWFNSNRASDLEDVFGRTLADPIDLSFATDHRLPNFELPHTKAVLEKQIDSDVPLYINNIDSVTFHYETLTADGLETEQSLYVGDSAQVKNIQFAIPMRIREMLNHKSGMVQGWIETEPVIKNNNHNRQLSAIVTPYQLHAKIGHYNSVVWVTDLATGEPVSNARVQIYKDIANTLSSDFEPLDTGMTDASGLATLEGTRTLDPKLAAFGWCADYDHNCDDLFIRVDKAGDMALMPLKDHFAIHPYRVSNNTVWANTKREYGHIHTWGTTAQGVYRAGGTIQYKLYVRDQNNDTYVPAPRENYTLSIIDPTGKTVDEIQQIKLSEFGSYDGTYSIPKNGAVGWYDFHLKSDFTGYSWQPMRVLVSDFTPSPFKVTNQLNGDRFYPDEEVEVVSNASLHSGGAYTDAESRVTATIQAETFTSQHPIATDFTFDSYSDHSTQMIFQKMDRVDDKGKSTLRFTLPKQDIIFGRLNVETAVRDDRGAYISTNSQADYIAVDRLVGLKHTKWLYEADKPANIRYLVADANGAPVAGTDVTIDVEYLHTKAAKVKGAGNAYLTNYINEWIAVDTCEGRSTTESLTCSFTPQKPGTYKIIATIQDTKGNTHTTQTQAWVAGKGRVLWNMPNSNALTIIPEKTEYNIGDTARYLVKNPYPGAKALISIERYGVLKSWVQTLDDSTAVIEFDVEKDFMPGFYLSVMIVSPRVETPPPEMGQVDLGKPSFKIGYVKVPVTDPYKQMDVTVTIDAPVYKPRDMVTATIHAEPKHKGKNEPVEIAVVVLDEAVLDLLQAGKKSFDPYAGFYKMDGLDLRNYSLLKRLIGRQKFEKKGANPGGDGGADINMRSLFKYVSYWNPSLTPDAQGNATITFQVPDNLTGWRVLAFAVTPTDRMGLGDGNFKVNRPTEIRPVMPNQITEGDTFQAGFSVMNRTDKPRKIDVTIEAKGPIQPHEIQMKEGLFDCVHNKGPSQTCAYHHMIDLPAYKRKTVYMPVSSTSLPNIPGKQTGAIAFTATASDALDGDGMTHYVPIHKRRALETAANYGSTTEKNISESLLFPQNIHSDVGNVSVVLSPSIISNIAGAFRYMRHYAYTCWEQKLSRAVSAAHYQHLHTYLPDDLEWEDSKHLPDDILEQAVSHQAPNGGMAYYLAKDRYVSPYLSAYTALAFNWLRASDYDVPEKVESKLHSYLQQMLRKDVLPTFYSKGMSSTVRAVALAALAPHGKVSRQDLERYHLHMDHMSLFGKAHYLHAATTVTGAESIAKDAADAILAHASQSGGKFSFNEVLDGSYTRILSTPLRENCAILSAMTAYGKSASGSELVGDVPFKLVRSITQARGNRDHWENTQENIFCMNGLVDYARIYESVKPDMRVNVKLDDTKIGNTTFTHLRDASVTLIRPITVKDPGTKRKIHISRKGAGRLYYATRMQYASKDENASRVNAGIDIRKEYSVERNKVWVLLENPHQIKQGELIRVDIYVSIPTARHFVVVDDPVPGGLEPLNRDLATTSVVDADKGTFQAAGESWWFTFDDWYPFNLSRWGFYHQELRHNAVRFYSDYLYAGNYHLSYMAQAIAEGEFTKMPVHAEEMYDPDVFGKGLPGVVKIAK